MHVKKLAHMSSLGISPLVAAVLLIAVTMTIAGLMAYWATSYVKTSLPETNQTEIDCRFADFSIYSCVFYNSTNAVNLILENHQNIELNTLQAYLMFPNSSVSSPINLEGNLPSGALRSFQITNVQDDFSRIIIGTQCPELRVEKVCTKA